MSSKVPMRFDLEMMKWVADKIENKDYSVFPFEFKECEKCGAAYLPQFGHDCSRIVELQMNAVKDGDEIEPLDAEPQTDLVNDSQILAKNLVDDEFNPYDEECMRCKHLKLKCEFIPTYCKFESRDEPQTDCAWKKGEDD